MICSVGTRNCKLFRDVVLVASNFAALSAVMPSAPFALSPHDAVRSQQHPIPISTEVPRSPSGRRRCGVGPGRDGHGQTGSQESEGNIQTVGAGPRSGGRPGPDPTGLARASGCCQPAKFPSGGRKAGLYKAVLSVVQVGQEKLGRPSRSPQSPVIIRGLHHANVLMNDGGFGGDRTSPPILLKCERITVPDTIPHAAPAAAP